MDRKSFLKHNKLIKALTKGEFQTQQNEIEDSKKRKICTSFSRRSEQNVRALEVKISNEFESVRQEEKKVFDSKGHHEV
ncbi:CLUMA_CG002738, isoform A [Clunio marinus]|uniref:CLUMA_CG002738, isoform A n=1 Tax=Clunio marinus TaxID=568069 RepID=A0A1J1HMX2_9DIPT|nr:CLUMA_CG002738, isoform A [Clunio marinus]